jgi:hypothetical protein
MVKPANRKHFVPPWIDTNCFPNIHIYHIFHTLPGDSIPNTPFNSTEHMYHHVDNSYWFQILVLGSVHLNHRSTPPPSPPLIYSTIVLSQAWNRW